MDVRCEKCRAQYVLEDERITEAGLTVRCSACGYTFRVKKKALFVTVPAAPDSGDAAPLPKRSQNVLEKREWRVRQSKGEVFITCRELTTLQKWIVERKVGRNHEISLAGSGDTWKRLGDIPELASFFQVVEAAERAKSTTVATAAPAAGAVFPTLTPLSAPAALKEPLPAPPARREPAPAVTAATKPQRTTSLSTPFEEAFDEPGLFGPEPGVQSNLGAASATWEAKPSAPLPAPEAAEPAWASGPPVALRDAPAIGRPPKAKSSRVGKLFFLLLLVAGSGAIYFFRPTWIGLGAPTLPGQTVPAPLPEPAPPQPLPTVQEVKPTETAPPAQAKENPPASANAAVPPAPPHTLPTVPEPKSAPEPAAPPPSGAAAAGSGEPPATAPPVDSPEIAKPPPPEPKPEEAKAEPPAAPPPPAVTPQQSPVAVQPKEKPVPKKEVAKPESPAKRFRSLLLQARRMRDRGKSREALVLYGQASDIDPNSPDVYAGQGWCRLDLSQYDAAIENFEAALQRAPKHPDALMGLAETYRYAGRNAEAIKYYQRYLADHPNGEDAAAARNAVSQLKE